MKTHRLLLASAAALLAGAAHAKEPKLEEFAAFPTQQVTGVTVSKTGRVFANFPYWADTHTVSVVEVAKGAEPKPFPDAAWNSKDGPAGGRFVCVQSVVVDDTDALWILDPAAPKTETIVPGGPKLVKVDLATNAVVQTIPFDLSIAPAKSYLNDLRIDTKSGHAFITESGEGALVIVDLKSGKARRLLAGHPSTKVESGKKLVVDGFDLIDPKTGKPPQFHADGIALDAAGGWLYYHALTAKTLYRIKTEHLKNEQLTDEQLAGHVKKIAETPAPDGMLEDKDAASTSPPSRKTPSRASIPPPGRPRPSSPTTACNGPTPWRGGRTGSST